MTLQLAVVTFFGLCGSLYACQTIYLDGNVTNHFDSHRHYERGERYSNFVHKCWTLRAPPGYVIKAWTDGFHLEQEYDYMHVLCGEHGHDGIIGEYTGRHGIRSPVYSDGTIMRVEFITDNSETRRGFRFMYETELATGEQGDCIPWGEYDMGSRPDEHWYEDWDSYDHKKDDKNDDGISGGTVATIVGAIVAMLVVIATIIACVVCFMFYIRGREQSGGVRNQPMQSVSNTGFSNPISPPAYAQNAQQMNNEEKVAPPDFPAV